MSHNATVCAAQLKDFFSFHLNYKLRLPPLSRPAARSPVFSHLSSSLNGLWTIRAFGAEQRFQDVFDAHQDLHSGFPQHLSSVRSSRVSPASVTCLSSSCTESWFLFLTISRWFAVRLDGICSIFVIMVLFGCLLLRNRKAQCLTF